jgi:hypothetical protein
MSINDPLESFQDFHQLLKKANAISESLPEYVAFLEKRQLFVSEYLMDLGFIQN